MRKNDDNINGTRPRFPEVPTCFFCFPGKNTNIASGCPPGLGMTWSKKASNCRHTWIQKPKLQTENANMKTRKPLEFHFRSQTKLFNLKVTKLTIASSLPYVFGTIKFFSGQLLFLQNYFPQKVVFLEFLLLLFNLHHPCIL